MGGYLIYKCRKCGKEIMSFHVPDGNLALFCIINNIDLPKEWGGIIPITDIHICDDKILGVTDLIGFKED